MAIAAQTGSLPVAKATTVRTRARAAATSVTRRAIPEGPAEPAAATTTPASAPRSVALKWGKGELSAAPAKSPAAK
jgi:hypothetical protein